MAIPRFAAAAASPAVKARYRSAVSSIIKRSQSRASAEPGRLEVCLLLTATQEDFMRIRLLVAAAGLVAIATPSLAAEYFVVQDTATKRCSIVEQRPTCPQSAPQLLYQS